MPDPASSPEIKTYAGVKWGLQNPSVIIVGVHYPGPQDNLVLVYEFYRDGVLLPEMVAAAFITYVSHLLGRINCENITDR